MQVKRKESSSPPAAMASARGVVGRSCAPGDEIAAPRSLAWRRSIGEGDAKKARDPRFRAFKFRPRKCRQAGILNLGSDRSLSFRIRHARFSGHTQQRFLWAATNANEHWFKESMTLTNTAGNSLGVFVTCYCGFNTASSSVSMWQILRRKASMSSPISDSNF